VASWTSEAGRGDPKEKDRRKDEKSRRWQSNLRFSREIESFLLEIYQPRN